MLRFLAWGAAGVIAVIAVALLVLFLFREQLTAFYLNPGEPFAAMTPPSAPDYENPDAWAALPGRADLADLSPPGMAPAVSDDAARVDVFFVHPTTYLSSASWNAPLDDEQSQRIMQVGVMGHQASAYNLAGRIYAPRYRQATLYSFMEPWDELAEPQGQLALDLAYQDVARAFETYIRLYNNGRPFILAAHSQGSLHLLRLLQDYMKRPDLLARMVAAYPAGMSVPASLFDTYLSHIPPCATPEQTGCLVSWNTFGPDGNPTVWFEQQRIWEGSQLVPVAGRALNCTNPLSWRTDGEPAGGDQHKGAIPYAGIESDEPLTRLADPQMLAFNVQCRDGIAYMDASPPDEFGELVIENDDYHVYDYNLFYGSIRENAALRAAAYLALQ
ncbi:DUF3089 domain-containing protein [Pyruvatibacter sp.]|uniref:DUF3089 domain-containing protein n=1 Tax=Pyruvatibacter sp. TaxID=1981328 RepID=UPI0032EADA8D